MQTNPTGFTHFIAKLTVGFCEGVFHAIPNSLYHASRCCDVCCFPFTLVFVPLVMAVTLVASPLVSAYTSVMSDYVEIETPRPPRLPEPENTHAVITRLMPVESEDFQITLENYQAPATTAIKTVPHKDANKSIVKPSSTAPEKPKKKVAFAINVIIHNIGDALQTNKNCCSPSLG